MSENTYDIDEDIDVIAHEETHFENTHSFFANEVKKDRQLLWERK